MESTTQIVNRRPTLLHLPPVVIVQKDALGEERPDTGKVTSLMPGGKDKAVITDVPTPVWERAAKHPVVKQWLRIGWIRVATPEDKAKGAGPVDIMGLNLSAAMACVEVEESRAVLDGWLKMEERDPVRSAIAARLARLPAKK